MSLYRIELERDDNGTWLVTCPILPEVTTFCENASEAQPVAQMAIEEALAARISGGQPAPTEPDLAAPPLSENAQSVVMPLQTSLKVDLYNAMRSEGVTKAELGRRLHWHPPQVDRLLRLDHASRLEQLDLAFHALGLAPEIRFSPIARTAA